MMREGPAEDDVICSAIVSVRSSRLTRRTVWKTGTQMN
jgi:hypothetical protein